MDHLDELEAQSVYLLREAYHSFSNLCMPSTMDQASNVLIWLSRKAFCGKIPFPLVQIDSPGGKAAHDPVSLQQVLAGRKFDALITATRRDECYFSPFNAEFESDDKDQPPEFWNQFTTALEPGGHMRVQPLLDWTEADIRQYIEREKISVPQMSSTRPDEERVSRAVPDLRPKGPAILEAFDRLKLTAPAGELPLRFVLQDIYRFDERRILAGRIETGTLKVGQEIMFWPDGKHSRVKSIEAWNAPTPPTEAGMGESVAITLEEQIFVERGQIGSLPEEGPAEGREIHATVFWLQNEPLVPNEAFTLKLGTQSVEARVIDIKHGLDPSTLKPLPGALGVIRKNEVADVRIRVRKPVAYDRHDRANETGRFVIVTGKHVGGGGIIREAEYPSKDHFVTSDNLTWTISSVTREARAEHFGHRGAVIWFTGFSGSGKSTLAMGLEHHLHLRGIMSFILDGDNVRHGLCSNLGFSDEDRTENIRRAGETAKLLAEAGLVVICSLISPFRADRQRAREVCQRDGVPFAEIFINAPLSVCEARDPRGLYKRARAGEIAKFTGLSSPYEPPENPELNLRTAEYSLDITLAKLLDFVADLARIPQHLEPEGLSEGSGI